jgi:hypothetical protein
VVEPSTTATRSPARVAASAAIAGMLGQISTSLPLSWCADQARAPGTATFSTFINRARFPPMIFATRSSVAPSSSAT